jgi:UDP-GlcNAc3NAcA epimerase
MKPLRIAQIVGARPQFIKLAPVSRALHEHSGVEELIVHTGQHYDPQLSEVFFEELEIRAPAANLEVGSGSHGKQTALMLERIEAWLLESRPSAVIVYGDTNSTLAGTLAAVKIQIPVAHVEAGLRSFNRAMPEELNRVATDHLCDLLLAPTPAAVENLAREGLESRTLRVGDVMYDAVRHNRERAQRRSSVLERLALTPGTYALATVHRAESTQPEVLGPLMQLLCEIARDALPVIYPVHPRTRDAIRRHLPGFQPASSLRMIDPVGSLDMLRLTDASSLVLTDSGGLQKEAFMLGVPCITLRTETEWVETLVGGANTIVGHDRGATLAAVARARGMSPQGRLAVGEGADLVYGGGCAAARCAAAVLALARGQRVDGASE